MDEISLTHIIGNLESLFSKFNERFFNNELQPPVITVSPDTTKGAYGWCTAWKAWSIDEHKKIAEFSTMIKEDFEVLKNDDGYYEINICAEYLGNPFEQIAGTLLHEMVHLYNLQIGVQDTSRSGTYHNKRFKNAAEQHGLTVEKIKTYGWAKTSLNDEAKVFIDSIDDNEKEFQLYRKRLSKPSGAANTKQSTRKYICPICGCIIRATKKVNVVCGDCNVKFKEEA